jgi:hypothetical protein
MSYAATLRLVAVVLAVTAVSSSARVELLVGDELVILEGATLIDGSGAEARPRSVVVARGGRIVAVGTVGDFRYPSDATVLDLSGQWLLPGFVDVHAHARAAWVLEGLLAAGITTIRNPSSSVAGGVDFREAAASGAVRGPRVFTAGRVIDAPPGYWPDAAVVATEEEIRAEVRRQANAGVDIIKLYVRLPPELVRAGIDEAHAQGLPVIGDLAATSWTEAARFGIDFVTHGVPRHSSLLPAGVRATYERDVRTRRAHPFYRWFELVDLAGPEIDSMIEALATHGVAVDPTLVAIEAVLRSGDPAYQVLVDRESVPHRVLSDWRGAGLSSRWPADYLRRAADAWPEVLTLARLLHERGVLLLAGTDTPLPWVVPGVSFHRELELLEAAGISRLDVLSIATRNGALALGIVHEAGTVTAGKRADLVVLRADPLRDIRNTRHVAWVMKGGIRYDPTELRAAEQ